jgi:hypothetical protein
VEIVTRIHTARPVERLIRHPRLPLIAGWDAARPTIRVWDHSGGRLAEIDRVGGDLPAYGDRRDWDRVPDAAWHPREVRLVVSRKDGVAGWTPDGIAPIPGVPPMTGMRQVAFSPDGRALWLTPAPGWEDDWTVSLAIDLATGATVAGPAWDTGVVVHPGGGLVVTQTSDQAETMVCFATTEGGVMRRLRRALAIAVDGYQSPVFSPDGRHFAIRGNAYDNTLEIFGFPSLERTGGLILGDDDSRWPDHNIAFGPSGTLWIGTPAGLLLEHHPDGRTVPHRLADTAVEALASTADGSLIVAVADEILLVSATTAAPETPPSTAKTAASAVAEFLAGTVHGDDFDPVGNPGTPWIRLSTTGKVLPL